MDDELRRWKADAALRLTIVVVAAHSCILGLAMLFATGLVLETFGIDGDVPLFFPSQSGVFMLILGILYFFALVEPAFVRAIILSKSVAVAFLVVHAALLSAPPIIWAAAAGDATMLAAVVLMLARHRRRAD